MLSIITLLASICRLFPAIEKLVELIYVEIQLSRKIENDKILDTANADVINRVRNDKSRELQEMGGSPGFSEGPRS